MSDNTETSSVAFPDDLRVLLFEKVDLNAAFLALSGYKHFYSESLRGRICTLQVRPEEAVKHFEEAERLAIEAPVNPKNRHRHFLLRAFSLDNAVLLEAKKPRGETSDFLDREMTRLLEFDLPSDDLSLAQLQINAIGYYQLLKKEYSAALLTFETLLQESSSRLEDQQINFYAGAAAAAKALGNEELAQRHYENAALGVNTISQPLNIALFSARLYALLSYWGRSAEAAEWLHRLQALPCPEESRECFIQRAQLFTAASTAREHIFIA